MDNWATEDDGGQRSDNDRAMGKIALGETATVNNETVKRVTNKTAQYKIVAFK